MSRETLLQSNFNAGVVSERLLGRTDFKKYASACYKLSNVIGLVSGPATFRPGTVFIDEAYNPLTKSRLIPFKYNTEQAYILEFSPLKIRFFKDRGVILNSSNAEYEIASPYTEADLPYLSFSQDADVLYISIPSNTVPPKVLQRFDHDNWVLSTLDFIDGPYLDANTTTTTITPSGVAVGASITLTASAALWVSTDVNRLVRWRQTSSTSWGYCKITSYTSSTVVQATVMKALGVAGASTEWRLGAFSETTGYPALVTLHEGRLVFARTRTKPNFVWLSESQGYGGTQVLWAPSAISGTVSDSSSIYFPLSAGDVSTIMWMSSGSVLAIGTADAEWVVEGSDTAKALSPTNTRATRRTTHGSLLNVPAVRIDGTVMFAKGSGSRVNRFVFNFGKDEYESTNISLLGEHLFAGKEVAEMVYAPEPLSVMWVRFTDGTLAALTFVDSEDVGGWSEHQITGRNYTGSFAGGAAMGVLGLTYSDAIEHGIVESMAVIPSSDRRYSELWMVVKRTINGSTVRYIEVMERAFFKDDQEDAVYLDCSLSYDGAPVTTLSGLDHLEGEEVGILADGAQHANQTVTGGSITISTEARKVTVGLPYVGDIETLDFDAVNQFNGSSMGQIRRISQVSVRLFETGLLYHARADQGDDALTLLEPREANTPQDTAPPLKTGIYKLDHEPSWDLSARLHIQFRSPLPATVAAIMYKAQVNEG